LVGDDSARSVAALQQVRTVAGTSDMAVNRTGADAELVVCGWAGAAAELQALRGKRAPAFGVYLAPWLMTAPLVTSAPSVATLVPLPFDPGSPPAIAYAAALARIWPGATPTPSGFATYQGLVPSVGEIRLYASALVSVLPTSLGPSHTGTAGWLPGGAITPVSLPLAAPP
jgi:hypothetical protein